MPNDVHLWRRVRLDVASGADALVTEGERIAWIGREADLDAATRARAAAITDLRGAYLTPGLIDCHTHLVFAGHRADEFAQRLRGVSYEAIARAGGGIRSTMRATRAASEDELVASAAKRLDALLGEGVTVVEIKSGYGLTLEAEARMLRAARRLARERPVTVRTTCLAAHAVPPEFAGRQGDYVRVLAREWLPQLAAERLVDAVDVYCDRGAFTLEESRTVLESARALGLPVKVHADQFENLGAVALGAQLGALSCDHLEETRASDVGAMAAAGTVAVLLPVAYYGLGQQRPPPVAALRTAGVPMAVATDCNPGTAPCTSILLAMNMATRLFGLTAEETLAGVTRHAARALGLQASHGRLAVGAAADFAAWDIESPAELAYWNGFNPCIATVRAGRLVRGAR
jgi:imidazolonepropionase